MLIFSTCSGLAQEIEDPPVPVLLPSNSGEEKLVRVAMVDSGVNYTLPIIRDALARTSKGELIGYDFWDMDEQPFDRHLAPSGRIQRHGTQTASLLIQEAPFIRLVPYRYPRPDMSRMAQLLAHASENGVRVIGLPLGGNTKDEWLVFEAAAEKYLNILFIASAGNNNRNIDESPVYPASLTTSNMLVVTSADDFVRPAEGVNWGRTSVDYMVPAEMQSVIRFDGSKGVVSGSSYAVSRVVALAARIIRDDASLDAAGVIKKIRGLFANGALPKQLGQGYIHDPRVDSNHLITTLEEYQWRVADTVLGRMQDEDQRDELISIPIDVLILSEEWPRDAVLNVIDGAQAILSQCQVVFVDVDIRVVAAPEYLQNLEAGASRTIMDAMRRSGINRQPTVVFANDTRMNQPYDAEAFGKGNTRSRPWLTDSVWLTLALRDRSIALAHELFHVFANSGQHSDSAGNLMLGRTTGNNRELTPSQCAFMRANVLQAGLGQL